MRVRGMSMEGAGIFDNDILVVNRALKHRSGQIVAAVVDEDFTVKYLHIRAGRLRLNAANPTFADIVPKDGQTVTIWGVVTACVKEFPV
jgi:DNA polymerase V